MDSSTLLIIIAAVAVVTAVLSAALVASGRRGRGAKDGSPAGSPAPGGARGGEAGGRDSGGGASGTSGGAAAGSGDGGGSAVGVLERPEASAGRLQRLRARLAGSQNAFGRGLLAVLSRDAIDDQTWSDLEDTLVIADVGVEASRELVDRLRTRVRVDGVSDPHALKGLLREELVRTVDPSMDRSLAVERVGDHPAIVMVVGVNGTGKTTTTGKLARLLVADDKDVLLGAADTFRAAASEQLTTWGERVGVPTVRGPEGSDPASVAFEAVKAGIENEVDVVLIDTAGRLHTKSGLMDELGKVKRVVEKQAAVGEVLLVLDATTGQNGMVQAKVFGDVVDITGIVLTKLDGSAKGGIVIAVQRELGVPVKFVGLGEGVDDLAPFDAAAFIDALLESPAAP
jgi:fused signal recognition particle receptor